MKRSLRSRLKNINHTLKFRFFVSVGITAVVFIAVMLVLNLLFFQNYYLYQKQNDLVETYHYIDNQYDGEISALEDTLKEVENSNNIRISIIDSKYGLYIYDTIFTHDRADDKYGLDTQDSIGKLMYAYDSEDFEKNGYAFAWLEDQHGGTSYIALVGKLNTEDMVALRVPVTMMNESQSVNFVFLLISGLIALLVCLIVGYQIGKRFTRPITEMIDVANAVSRLDFSKKYTGRQNDELGELGKSINQMSEYLESTITEMQQMNEQLQTEIEKKERIDNMRKEFIINVSHELKTPIALIQGYAEGLRVGINESEEDKNYYCDIIIDEAHRMNHLVRQLLDLSKIELGNTLPMYTEIDAYELAETVVSKTEVMWQEKHQHIDMSGIGEYELQGDYDMLERALLNYMTNAIDHAPEGGHIWLLATADTKHIVLTVRNEGCSLDPEEMDKIWDKFYKLDKARTRVSGGGSGIGLSIVRAIMTAHGGGCGVRNVEGGVEFYLSLPKKPPENVQKEFDEPGIIPN